MKRALIMMSVIALAGGCGSSGNNGSGGNGGSDGGGGGGMDLSAAAGGDLAMTLPPDMQPAYGCRALLACLNGCTDNTCAQTCAASSTQPAVMLYLSLRSCWRRECYPHPDAGPAPCTKGGGNGAQCTMCIDDSMKAAGSCGADTTYCGTCYAQAMACAASTP